MGEKTKEGHTHKQTKEKRSGGKRERWKPEQPTRQLHITNDSTHTHTHTLGIYSANIAHTIAAEREKERERAIESCDSQMRLVGI
jgi:hypothetical protein